ncbi:TH1 domain-containing protein [Heracleum sosnowskyi]|uniref:TH1 domain-containing protein n=1 Tax=Heracleum sosnowskyi TaxID=360622 RepID=A0AAD8J7U1_9APIA|nr:TH1 domain-containing protein [Heracleum sosnowskyi]
MSWYQTRRKVQIDDPKPADDGKVTDGEEEEENNNNTRLKIKSLDKSSSRNVVNQEPFMGVKVRRKGSIIRDYKGDYLGVTSIPFLEKILEKHGDKKVFFADKVLKFTSTGKMKRRILLVTDFAVYIVDPDMGTLKRRVSLAAVEKVSLSELSDNFFAIIIPTEYDILMASTRKTEIVNMLMEATQSTSNYELEVLLSNSFEYNAAADLVKEIIFEEVEGGVKTRIRRK